MFDNHTSLHDVHHAPHEACSSGSWSPPSESDIGSVNYKAVWDGCPTCFCALQGSVMVSGCGSSEFAQDVRDVEPHGPNRFNNVCFGDPNSRWIICTYDRPVIVITAIMIPCLDRNILYDLAVRCILRPGTLPLAPCWVDTCDEFLTAGEVCR